MRIVIDMQGVQGSNGQRGIGRYSLSLAKAIVRNKGEHEIIIVLNGLFPDTIEPIRAAFNNILPQQNICVWCAPGPVIESESKNENRNNVAEYLRETFLVSLNPDVILVSSLIEGFNDNVVTSINTLNNIIPTIVILYDLIPMIQRHPYLDNPVFKKWYEKKVDNMCRADMLLSISESSQKEGISYLGFSNKNCINISTAADHHFKPIKIDIELESSVRERYGLLKQFVMYTGGIDPRKNIEGLIRAYSMLPKSLRDSHQLAIICSIQTVDRTALETLAIKSGLSSGELILTGFVSDEDLSTLYNLCKVFVFPSFHEGFGLPVLEAMSCGKAVIGSNTSSVPEVIGLTEALFDPKDDKSISFKIQQVISDDNFRLRLEKHGLEQSKKFSWDKSAQKAILAIENLILETNKISNLAIDNQKLPRLAYVSPLPPDRSGISYYSVELLPELIKYYQIDVIVEKSDVSNDWIKDNCNIRTVKWFKDNSNLYDRVIYHFGNSEFHKHMFRLLEEIPGVVVLHDFFLSGIVAHMDITEYQSNIWSKYIYISHGYKALFDRYHSKDTADVVWKYPTSLSVLQNAKSVIVHSENSIHLAQKWYGYESDEKISVIPLLRVPVKNLQHSKAREELGISQKAFVICSFGILGTTKLNHRLLSAFLSSCLAKDPNCYLIFVGENNESDYGKKLIETINNSNLKEKIKITGWVNDVKFNQYLECSDIGVQLRTLSRGETSAAVLDCMNYGIPTIVNAHGSNANLPKEAVLMIPDDFTDSELVIALELLYKNPKKRELISNKAKEIIIEKHNPAICAKQYINVIEKVYKKDFASLPVLINHIASNKGSSLEDYDLLELSNCLAENFIINPHVKQIFLDISELVKYDSKTGIQRVVRSLLKELIDNPPDGYRIEPVYATTNQSYRYARKFTLSFINCSESLLSDDPIEFKNGDIFIGLDLQPLVVISKQSFYQKLRNYGVQVIFLVYDLLPIILPKAFPEKSAKLHHDWLKVVIESDGAICISKAVSEELMEWCRKNQEKNRLRPFKINWFHLGSDVKNSVPSFGLPINAENILSALSCRPTFLTVGTIEPRKGQAQILSAFELLWKNDVDINLVIVGKQGWMMDNFIKRLLHHSEYNKHLFWLEGISDEYLEKIYSFSTCLIAASEGEGFGLPLIEAARHNLPIIARDIAVFREVAGDNALYFNGIDPENLSISINNWLALNAIGKAPQSRSILWLTWKQSACQFLDIILPKVIFLNHIKTQVIDISNITINKEIELNKDNKTKVTTKLINSFKNIILHSKFKKQFKKIYYLFKLNKINF